MFNKVAKGVCTSAAMVFSDPSSPAAAASLNTVTPEVTEDDPGDPELADKGDIQMEYSPD
jgi:hypothetical protein